MILRIELLLITCTGSAKYTKLHTDKFSVQNYGKLNYGKPYDVLFQVIKYINKKLQHITLKLCTIK